MLIMKWQLFGPGLNVRIEKLTTKVLVNLSSFFGE